MQTSLTVGFLVPRSGTRTTELLGFAASGIGNQESPVIVDQDFLDFILCRLIHICVSE